VADLKLGGEGVDLDSIGWMDGGFSEKVIPYLTGNKAYDRKVSDFTSDSDRKTLREALKSWCENKKLVTAAVDPDKAGPGGARTRIRLIDGARAGNWPVKHAYTIWGYDDKTETLLIRNPWRYGRFGPTYTEASPCEPINLKEFLEDFSYVQFEVWDGAPPELLSKLKPGLSPLAIAGIAVGAAVVAGAVAFGIYEAVESSKKRESNPANPPPKPNTAPQGAAPSPTHGQSSPQTKPSATPAGAASPPPNHAPSQASPHANPNTTPHGAAPPPKQQSSAANQAAKPSATPHGNAPHGPNDSKKNGKH
jgi:hypothetical protein